MRNGLPIAARPIQYGNRFIAPGTSHIGYFDRPDIHQNIRRIQTGWNIGDHGYGWHGWNGIDVCHHYDTFGFHWWGFYVGNSYFWTRYHNDGYWWYDPYWHRWCSLHDGRWWWNSPTNVVYVYIGGSYYQYNNGGSGVVITPDPTPPIEVPPTTPTPVDPTPVDPQPGDDTPPIIVPAKEVYSTDGKFSVQITADGSAYLYDLTAAVPQARPLSSGVTDASFDYDYVPTNDIHHPYAPVVSRIQLTYVDGTKRAFGRDGVPQSLQSFELKSAAAASAQTLQQNMQGSPAFSALKSGVNW